MATPSAASPAMHDRDGTMHARKVPYDRTLHEGACLTGIQVVAPGSGLPRMRTRPSGQHFTLRRMPGKSPLSGPLAPAPCAKARASPVLPFPGSQTPAPSAEARQRLLKAQVELLRCGPAACTGALDSLQADAGQLRVDLVRPDALLRIHLPFAHLHAAKTGNDLSAHATLPLPAPSRSHARAHTVPDAPEGSVGMQVLCCLCKPGADAM